MTRALAGQVALITGSGRGLGHAVAMRLAELGAAVAVHDVTHEAPAEFGEFANLQAAADVIAQQHGVRALAVTGDVADDAAVRDMAARVTSDLGPIDLLVNCAGGDIAAAGGKPKPNDGVFIKSPDVRALIDRNLVGTINACRAVVPGMIDRKRGAIVNFGSGAAHGGCADGVVYAVAKAAVLHYTRCLAVQLRPFGIRANAISPGPTRTARFLATRPVKAELMDESVPLGRYALPSEIADAAGFLCGPEARFITGQTLLVDGGWAR